MKIFKNRDLSHKPVDCEDAADKLRGLTGLRMTCPDDVDETPSILGADAPEKAAEKSQ